MPRQGQSKKVRPEPRLRYTSRFGGYESEQADDVDNFTAWEEAREDLE